MLRKTLFFLKMTKKFSNVSTQSIIYLNIIIPHTNLLEM